MRLSEARLEASDVGALVRGVHLCGAGFVRGGQVGARKDVQPSGGLSRVGGGGVCRLEECAEWVRCSFPSAESGVQPAASDSEVGCYVLWCCVRPHFRRRGCCFGGRELWV